MKPDRSVLYKTAVLVAVLVATAAWIWLLYGGVKWLILALRHS